MIAPHPLLAARSAGALLHLSSLPDGQGVGDLGPAAHRFVDWLADAGLTWWQMLPVGPIGAGDSPYSSPSAFAGEPLFLSLERLRDDGLLGDDDLRAPASLGRGRVDYGATRRFKQPRLARACRTFFDRGEHRRKNYRAFCRRAADWLEPWVSFRGDEPDLERFLQFQLDRQWRALRGHASSRGVRLMGDLPIFVELDSADVRAHPELFLLDRAGRPRFVTGVPPDAFSSTGQLWGHPHYAWPAHRRTGFDWWARRVEVQLERFDLLRVDHFIGFHRAWRVRPGATTTAGGRWVRAPGRALLASLRDRLGALPFVAEDLGAVTPEVRALRDAFGLPGMRILQYGFGHGASYDRTHSYPPHCVAYPGTHDNPTARGWWTGLSKHDRRRAESLGIRDETAPWDLVRLVFASPARTAIAPIQDIAGLDESARMNQPGTALGNWAWRLPRRALGRTLARRVRDLAEVTDRLPPPTE